MRKFALCFAVAFLAILPSCTAIAAPTYVESLACGGGYDDPAQHNGGLTVDNQGNVTTNGDISTDGALNADDLNLSGNLAVGGTATVTGATTLASPVTVVDNIADGNPIVQILENPGIPGAGYIVNYNGGVVAPDTGGGTGNAAIGIFGDADDDSANRAPRVLLGGGGAGSLFSMVMNAASGALSMLLNKADGDSTITISNPDSTYKTNLSVDGTLNLQGDEIVSGTQDQLYGATGPGLLFRKTPATGTDYFSIYTAGSGGIFASDNTFHFHNSQQLEDAYITGNNIILMKNPALPAPGLLTANSELWVNTYDGDYNLVLSASGSGTVNIDDDTKIGGGYGDTGVSVSGAGVIQANGAITTDGALTAASATIGGTAFSSKVTGPGSATDNAVMRFDGTGGKTAQNSGVLIGDSNDVTGVNSVAVGGGYGSTGATIYSTGNISANGNLVVDGTGLFTGTLTAATSSLSGMGISALYSGIAPFPQVTVQCDLLSSTNDMLLAIANSNGTYEANLYVEGDTQIDGSLSVGGTLALGNAITYANSNFEVRANGNSIHHLDYDNNSSGATWKIRANNSTDIFTVTEAGNTTVAGTSTLTGAITAFSTYTGIGDITTLGNVAGANVADNGKRIHNFQSATLSSDAFTATKSFIKLTSQTGTSDNLSTINGGTAGEEIIIRPVSGHTITVIHNTGNIKCIGGTNMVLSPYEHAVLFFDDDSNWYVLSNGA